MSAVPGPLVADITGWGPLVVLLHGQPGSAADWDTVVPLLSPHFTVAAVDRPGYGRTAGRTSDFDGNADAAVALLDRLGADRAVLVGHSWGGGVALAAAERHARRVAGLVLLGSVGPQEPVGFVDRMLASRPLGDIIAASTIGTAERLLSVPAVRGRLLPLLPDPARGLLSTLRPGGPVPAWRSFAAEQRAWVHAVAGLATTLARIEVPVTVVTGTSDHILAPEVASRLAAAIPGAELLRVPGVGHMLARDAPRSVADAVRQTARRGAGD